MPTIHDIDTGGRPPALQAEDGKRPQHENKTGLLLVVLDHHEEGALLDIPGVGLYLQRFLLEEGRGLRPDEADIQRMHQDKCNQQ